MLAGNSQNQDAIRAEGGIKALLQLLREGSKDVHVLIKDLWVGNLRAQAIAAAALTAPASVAQADVTAPLSILAKKSCIKNVICEKPALMKVLCEEIQKFQGVKRKKNG